MNNTLKEQSSHYTSPENIEEIRQRLIGVIDHFRISVSKVASCVDMTPPEICKFIREQSEVSFVTLMRIEDYIIEMEYEIRKELSE